MLWSLKKYLLFNSNAFSLNSALWSTTSNCVTRFYPIRESVRYQNKIHKSDSSQILCLGGQVRMHLMFQKKAQNIVSDEKKNEYEWLQTQGSPEFHVQTWKKKKKTTIGILFTWKTELVILLSSHKNRIDHWKLK